MKKLSLLILVLCILILSGCGKSPTGTEVSDPTVLTTTTTGIPTATVTFPEGFNVVQIAEKLEVSAQLLILLSLQMTLTISPHSATALLSLFPAHSVPSF